MFLKKKLELYSKEKRKENNQIQAIDIALKTSCPIDMKY